jgi:hypothetical protein
VGIWNSQKALRKLFRVCNLIQEATARGWTEGMEINPEKLKTTVTEIIADLGLINSQLEEIYNVVGSRRPGHSRGRCTTKWKPEMESDR